MWSASRIALAILLASCQTSGPSSPPVTSGAGFGDELATGEAGISVDHEAVLTFQADWNVVLASSPIMAGGTLRVDYDPKRLPNCRATKYGMPAWSILMYYETPGAGAQYVPLTQVGSVMRATIPVPEDATTIALWFFNNDYYGCKEYDSNLGKNYTFDVSQPAVASDVTFSSDWSESAGKLEQGGLMRLVYAPERLQTCRYAPGGARAYNIFASWLFLPGGQTDTVAMYEGDLYGGDAAILKPTVKVPTDATSVQLWFSNSDATGCVAWDSNFGDNYTFPVGLADGSTPKVGWAGDFDFVKTTDQSTHHGDVDPAYYWDAWQGIPMASWVEVAVWIPGVTDQPYGSPQAAASAAEQKVVAQAATDAVASGTWPLKFERQQGNNFVYSFRFAELRWGLSVPKIADGLYHYSVRFSTDGGGTWFDAPGDRRFVVGDKLACDLFPDGAPPECPKTAKVGWAGNWGGYFTHACYHQDGLPDPVVFTKSALGHDCMTVTAEVWVEGLTDKGGSPSAILAQVETNIAYGGGPLAAPVTYPLTYDGKVGNNYRFAWNTAQLVGMADRDDYQFRFRFSVDGGATYTTIGQGDGSGGGFRALWVRNDSQDIEAVQYCDDLELWEGPSAHFPTCVDYQPTADYDANFCELWVNALGKGQWSHNGASMEWLEAYVNVGSLEGQVVGVGMWTRFVDASGTERERWSLGEEIEPGYYRTGFTFAQTVPGAPSTDLPYEVGEFSFFVDVLRPTGGVERLWQSASGANYTVADAFAIAGYVKGIGSGSVEYADDSVSLFDQKHSCGK